VLHLLNPGATLLNAAAISIEAGVLLAAAYMLTRRLWLCIGTHIAWNFTQGGIFSVAVSGGENKGLLRSTLVGPDWLTGGTFGAEASVVALVVCFAAGIVLIVLAIKKRNVVPAFWANRTAPELKPESAAWWDAGRLLTASTSRPIFLTTKKLVDQYSTYLTGAIEPGKSQYFKISCGCKDTPPAEHDSYKLEVIGGY
jgi:hypothetical protein